MLKTRDMFVEEIKRAEENLMYFKFALEEFDSLIENNIFTNLEVAEREIAATLYSRAAEDCEGSYNCGLDSYTQEFIVNGIKYLGTLEVEYGRHDKTYYYIDDSKFRYEEAN